MTDVIDAPARPAGRNYVGGEWRPSSSGATYAKANPMRPSESVGEFSSSTEDDAAAAVAAAARAFDAWAALPLARRGAYLVAAAASLEARTDEIARHMSTEMGKPLREARLETGRAAQILRFAASEAFRSVGELFEQAATGAQVSTHRRPLGVVALIAEHVVADGAGRAETGRVAHVVIACTHQVARVPLFDQLGDRPRRR